MCHAYTPAWEGGREGRVQVYVRTYVRAVTCVLVHVPMTQQDLILINVFMNNHPDTLCGQNTL